MVMASGNKYTQDPIISALKLDMQNFHSFDKTITK